MGWRTAAQRLRIGRTGPIEFAALLALALYMTAVQAFGVDPAGPGERAAYWLVCILGGGVIAAGMEPWLERVPALAARAPLLACAMAVAMTFPITLLVFLVNGLALGAPLTVAAYGALFAKVLVVDCAVVAMAALLRLARARPAPPGPPGEPAARPNPLADRLPPKLARAAIVAVQAEDHYLRVYTAAGEGLVYMRFGDALAALAEADGLQVHRSWWVARRQVEEVRLKGGRGELRLAGGIAAPVSRSFAERVRAVDWAAPGP